MFKNTFVLCMASSYSLCILAADRQVFIGDLINLRTAVCDLIPSKAVAKWTSCYGLSGHSVLGASHSGAYVIIALRRSVICHFLSRDVV